MSKNYPGPILNDYDPAKVTDEMTENAAEAAALESDAIPESLESAIGPRYSWDRSLGMWRCHDCAAAAMIDHVTWDQLLDHGAIWHGAGEGA